jgi:hypothetical protein
VGRQLKRSGPKRLKSSDLSTARCKATPEVARRIKCAVPGPDAQLTLASGCSPACPPPTLPGVSLETSGPAGRSRWIIDMHDAEHYAITHSDLSRLSPTAECESSSASLALDDGWSINNQKKLNHGYLAIRFDELS